MSPANEHLRLRVLQAAVAVAAIAMLVVPPLAGRPATVRVSAVLVPALGLAILSLRPWRWSATDWRALEDWQPSVRVVWSVGLVVGLMLFWLVLTRFRSGDINAVDFTVYFDRPCFQTVHGRAMFVETAEASANSYRSQFSAHGEWVMLPLCSVYAVYPSPFWLLALSVLAIVAGAVHVLRIARHLGMNGVLAGATALAFALNDNTARTLNYGFHVEVLYAWFIPWLIDAGLRGDRRSFFAAAVACVLVKEDACMALFAASLALGFQGFGRMSRTDQTVCLVAPTALALVNLGAYYWLVVPALTPDGSPTYSGLWANYGATPARALVGMATHPMRVLADALTSGFFRTVMPPHLFLPLVGWRWALGIVPIVVLYGASASEPLRGFGVYYAIIMVPFLVIAASAGALAATRTLASGAGRAQIGAAVAILLGALLVGGGYSVRSWRAEIATLPNALGRLSQEPVVLVQSGLYPHAGYDERIHLLTPDALRDPRYAGAAVVLAPAIGAYPFKSGGLDGVKHLPPIGPMPRGLVAVRLPARAP